MRSLPVLDPELEAALELDPEATTEPESLDGYATIIVAVAGKDSIACLLTCIEQGVDLRRVELWHHEIDGREGSALMDWPCTPDYCRKLAAAFGVPIYFSWKAGGFEAEMHAWPEQMVWEILERHRINPHPCYRLGWGRCSCASCIFGNSNQWASLRKVNPRQFARIAAYEREFGKTINRNRKSVVELAREGTSYAMDPADVRAALSTTFEEPMILPAGAWRLPRGAYGDSTGPT